MGKADLHIHSTASDGLASPREILEYAQECTDLDLIAVTDHDMLDGALEAAALAKERRYRFQVIVGMEITTLEGHLLAYDIQKPIGMLQPLGRTLREIHRQGGFAVAPHPMSPLVRSIGQHGMLRVHYSNADGVYFDGIEVINPSLAGKLVYDKILALNQQLRLPPTGGSDSHTLETVGSAYTTFAGTTADDYRRALLAGQTLAGGSFWGMAETRRLLSIAGQQLYQSWFVLPRKHIRRYLGR
jgi:predicted metal-dependent phosphoesterase TrpH